jgi:hypothetical protein
MTVGDIVLTPGFNISREQLETLVGHEARHRAQWAVGTLIGGPFAFPVAYAVEDFFFPGSRNIFERQAGLTSGGYRHVGTEPVFGPARGTRHPGRNHCRGPAWYPAPASHGEISPPG